MPNTLRVEFFSSELLELPSGDPARARFGMGTAKAWAPLDAYDVNGLTAFVVRARRGGDLGLSAFEPRAVGDLARATEAKGETEPEKASNPVRLVAVGAECDGSPRVCNEVAQGDDSGNFIVEGEGGREDVEGTLESDASLELLPKIFCPLTEAKGELVDAYAMKPPFNDFQ